MLTNSYPEVVREHIAIQRKALDFVNGPGGSLRYWSTRGPNNPTQAQKRNVTTVPMPAFASPACAPSCNYVSKLVNNRNEVAGMNPAQRVVNLRRTGLLSYFSQRMIQEWTGLTAKDNGFKMVDEKRKLYTFECKHFKSVAYLF